MSTVNKVIEALLESEVSLTEEIKVKESEIKDLKDKRRGITRTLKSFGYVKPEPGTEVQEESVDQQPEQSE